ncbi:hypothetical protein QOT17_021932 [Balamuthia mandrillaris]
MVDSVENQVPCEKTSERTTLTFKKDTHHPHTAKPWREQTAVEKIRSKLEELVEPKGKKKKSSKLKQGLAKLTSPPKESTTTTRESTATTREAPISTTREGEKYYTKERTSRYGPEPKVHTYDMEEKTITGTTLPTTTTTLPSTTTTLPTTTTTEMKKEGGLLPKTSYEKSYYEEKKPEYREMESWQKPSTSTFREGDKYYPSTSPSTSTYKEGEKYYPSTSTSTYKEGEKYPSTYKAGEGYEPSLVKAEENVIEREGKIERRTRYSSKEGLGHEVHVIERGEIAPSTLPSHVEVIRRLKDRSKELQMVLDKMARTQSSLREAELDYHDQLSLARQEEAAAGRAKERLRELYSLVRNKEAEVRRLLQEEEEYERLRAQKHDQAIESESQRTKLTAEEALLHREIEARHDLANEHRRAAKHADDLLKAHKLALTELEGAKSALSQHSYDVEVIGERVVPRTRPMEIEVEAVPRAIPDITRIPSKQPVGEHRGRVISEELPKREKVQVDAAKAERVRERVEHIVISD